VTLQPGTLAHVAYVGRVTAPRAVPQAANFRKEVRPLAPGYSVGHRRVTAGSIGAFVTRSDGYLYVLSNNHVLANTNRGKKNDVILQPGKLDGGRHPKHLIGWLEHFQELAAVGNTIDAALASVSDELDYEVSYNGVDLVGVADAVDVKERVWKVGRTTGHTTGHVTAFDVDNVEVDYSDEGDGSLVYSFDSQIEIKGTAGKHFSRGGDSGSLILNADNHAVGLLFAGADETRITYANPIRLVLNAFGAKLILS